MAGGSDNEYLDLLGDRKLLKKVLRQSEEDRPKPGERVLIHYEWRRADVEQDEVLDSSRQRGEPFSFELGAQEVIPALEHGVASMSVGELASFTVHPDLAYGDAGCGGGAVPGSAKLLCELELLEAVSADAGLDDLSSEERLQAAMRGKDAGNALFKNGALEQAAKKYAVALEALTSCDEEEEEATWQDQMQREARDKTALACNLNLAQCEIKLGRHTEAFKHADAAMKIDASSSKAMYRRGVAALQLGLLECAKVDLLESARREPNNAEIRTHLQECQQRSREFETKERNAFGGMFDKANSKQKSKPDAALADAQLPESK